MRYVYIHKYTYTYVPIEVSLNLIDLKQYKFHTRISLTNATGKVKNALSLEMFLKTAIYTRYACLYMKT